MEEKPLVDLASHVLLLLTSVAKGDNLRCMLCSNSKSLSYRSARNHAVQVHGSLMGTSYNTSLIYRNITKLLEERLRSAEPIPYICHVWKTQFTSSLNTFLHCIIAHPFGDISESCCYECFRPIGHGNIIAHTEAYHSIRCEHCSRSFRSVELLISHCVHKHTYSWISLMDRDNRIMFSKISRSHTSFTRLNKRIPDYHRPVHQQ
jgi:hypothetical protein